MYFTGQRSEEAGLGSLYDYNARFYSPLLGRFISPDTIVPEPGNPQALNRYAYVLNNPLKYTDPSGHYSQCPGCFIDLRPFFYAVSIAARTSLSVVDRMRRDGMGGQLVVQMTDIIEANARTTLTDPVVVGAILRHESAAIERWALDGLADRGEAIQAQLAGDTASIGPGQMQIRRARELEQLGYVTARNSDQERIQALLGKETSVEYVTGMVRYLSDQLHTTFSSFSNLNTQDQQRLILIGYNIGWEGEKGLKANIEKYGFHWVIDYFGYDNQTLDEYLRWRAQR